MKIGKRSTDMGTTKALQSVFGFMCEYSRAAVLSLTRYGKEGKRSRQPGYLEWLEWSGPLSSPDQWEKLDGGERLASALAFDQIQKLLPGCFTAVNRKAVA